MDDIYDRYFADTALTRDQVIRVWKQTAKILHLPSGKLRPSDRFDTELAPVQGFPVEDELVDLGEILNELHFGSQEPSLPSLGAYVEWVVSHTSSAKGEI